MSNTPTTVSAQFGVLPITIETGKLAKLADGARRSRKARISSPSPSSTASARPRSAKFPAATSSAKAVRRKRKS
jgi:hypothetical protein